MVVWGGRATPRPGPGKFSAEDGGLCGEPGAHQGQGQDNFRRVDSHEHTKARARIIFGRGRMDVWRTRGTHAQGGGFFLDENVTRGKSVGPNTPGRRIFAPEWRVMCDMWFGK